MAPTLRTSAVGCWNWSSCMIGFIFQRCIQTQEMRTTISLILSSCNVLECVYRKNLYRQQQKNNILLFNFSPGRPNYSYSRSKRQRNPRLPDDSLLRHHSQPLSSANGEICETLPPKSSETSHDSPSQSPASASSRELPLEFLLWRVNHNSDL